MTKSKRYSKIYINYREEGGWWQLKLKGLSADGRVIISVRAVKPRSSGRGYKAQMKINIIHKAYKFRLKPSDEQVNHFAQIAGVCRLVWNLCLEQRKFVYASQRMSLNSYRQLPEVTLLRHEYDWIRDVPAQVLQQKVRDLDVAYRNFFEGRADFPERKKKGKSIDSFRFPNREALVCISLL